MNYIEKLQQIDAYAAKLGAPADNRTILFAMQHSNAEHMIAISLALREIADRHGLRLIVKPHPRQELSVLHEVRGIFGRSANASVLPRNADTYAALAEAGIVVGLNSNVLLEAALTGKPVLIAALASDLHPSIDFSLLRIAEKSRDAATLESQILDVVAGGPLSAQLMAAREEYLRKNPQFARPYSYERLESFIASALPRNVGERPNMRLIQPENTTAA
jgi:CDP-glycerol glycerophosphotransferase (TagB/SpsB family)